MGEDVENTAESERPALFIKALKNLIENIEMKDLKLSDYDIKKEDAEKFAKNAMESMGFLLQLDPCKLSLEDVVKIYES